MEAGRVRADSMSIFSCVMPMLWNRQIDSRIELTIQKGCTQGMRSEPERTPFNLNHQPNGVKNGRTCCNPQNLVDS